MKMVDISAKEVTEREAIVEGFVYLESRVIRLIKNKQMEKGDVLEAARLAGSSRPRKRLI